MLLLSRLEQLCLSHRAKELLPQTLTASRLTELRHGLAARLARTMVAENAANASATAPAVVDGASGGLPGALDTSRYHTLRPTAEELLEPTPIGLAWA